MIICEGGHDRVALASIAKVLQGWDLVSGVPNSLPEPINVAFPRFDPKPDDYRYVPITTYLAREDHYLEIRTLGGVENVFGKVALSLLKAIEPDAVGVLVDANKLGVKRRLTQFRNAYSKLYSHAKDGEAGKVWGKKPRLGFWVAPNNGDEGKLDHLLVEVAQDSKPELVQAGNEFTESLEAIEPGKWLDQREKALLAAIHQVVLPGASLATALLKSRCWPTESPKSTEAVGELAGFISRLAGVGS